MSWYDPTSWGVDWLGGNTAKAPSTTYAHQGQIEDAITQGLGAGNRQAPQAQGPNLGPQDQWRNMQMQQAQQLQGIASGQQMGAGEMAARRAAQQASAQQVGLANMQRGTAAPGAGLAAARNLVNIGGAAAGQAQQAALQDQQSANALLSSSLGQGRSGDLSASQMQQQVQLANLDAQLRQTGMNDQTRLAYLSQLTGMDANQLAAQMQIYAAQKGGGGGLLGGLLSTAGGIAGQVFQGAAQNGAGAPAGGTVASDERLKMDILDARDEVDEMLDALGGPKSWRYKDEKFGEGRFTGQMAQDFERSAAGRRIVRETPEGKMLDINGMLTASLSSVARLNERLRKLEAKG